MRSNFITSVLTEPAQLHSIADEWLDLYEHSAGVTPFQRPEWVLSWMDAFSPRDIATVEVRFESRLVGLAPLLIYSRANERVLAFMAGGVSDYLDFLVDSRYEAEVVGAVIDSIIRIDDWTELDLTDLSDQSILHRTALAEFKATHDNCSALALPETRDELLQLLSKRQRANLRNARSRLERAGGGDTEQATAETVQEFLDDLFRLHTNRWALTGEAGVLADDKVRMFHRTAGPKLFAHGILRLYRLHITDRPIAVLYVLRDRSTAFCYLQGFEPEFAFLSPGTQLMFYALEDAVQSRLRKFDFLRGEEAYKRHWRAEKELTYRIKTSRSAVSMVTSIATLAA